MTQEDRVPLHTRQIALQGFRRKDGLYDIEGHLRDTKSYDRASHGVVVKAGEPIHEMILRITIGTDFVIRDARAIPVVVPYAGHCDAITPKYGQLIGMKLAAGFMRDIKQMFGKTQGCTHFTELIGAVATAAFQTMSEEINASDSTQPFQLDGCHALRTDGPLVKAFHPKWFKPGRTAIE
jgi:hypothetical protein